MRFRIRFFKKRVKRRTNASSQKLYLLHKEAARKKVEEKVAIWNSLYGFSVGRIAIRNSRSRWGSCSLKGNLNFNYRLIFIREELFDYVVVHELAHLGEFNHGSGFWALVEHAIPDWKARRKELQTIRHVPVPSTIA
ncbi:MAG: M48 family metallopeptidase [Patescibacteria group bacterium]